MQDVLDVALQPGPASRLWYRQRQFREALPQRQLDVAAQVGVSFAGADIATGCQALEERGLQQTDRVALAPSIHTVVSRTRRPVPGQFVEEDSAADRASHDEPAGPGIHVDGSLHRTEDLGDDLPLVDQHGLRQAL